ncbi:hypothetical protein CPT_Paso_028 [Rhizobium phage Paso]|uniref:Uncharacterized protein n=1 Tax=Rhizobium phage Paso TaxID=2767574 RepID=A0A7L8G4Q7_9CAUD|nr:hypothetical protein CPT_Paso_028 [Rhizobium phage Paso]
MPTPFVPPADVQSKKDKYAGIPADKVYPKQRIVFKSGKHLNIFGAHSLNTDGSQIRIRDWKNDLFMYREQDVDYIQINEGPSN